MNYLRGCVADSRDLCQVIYNEMDDCDRQVWQLLMFPRILSCSQSVVNTFIYYGYLQLLQWAHETYNLTSLCRFMFKWARIQGKLHIMDWLWGPELLYSEYYFQVNAFPLHLNVLQWDIEHGMSASVIKFWIDHYIASEDICALRICKQHWNGWNESFEARCRLLVIGWEKE